MGGEVYAPLPISWKSPPNRLRKRQRSSKTDRQMGLQGRQTVRQVWQCVLAVPHPPLGSEWLLVNGPMAAALAHLALRQRAD